MLEVNDQTNCISDRLIRTDGQELVAKKMNSVPAQGQFS